ncbi:hypothetical protein SPRG_00697 [Saprolegnia parasitica CBS 223.65]|uniref:DNA mismatch repair proteins mutS family domain-containing protein n=1 Tax=Saprolegnia parasitica (strain CBS 223.65) TaxID=695850 RepID=A0A067CZF5_SAPPC|nr:hypothetical protein SPRG_00697 [Saprolegnia parasitica CBS 223.65]KDO34635.1 hypothetical protein SPRG_00697 [Saprolegnia parasitica CBS 223.65]|eukprot:XP_012194310.1 hypothetical protein SPRG_00697 [Saprolegnia parasitica CBS 223.65]
MDGPKRFRGATGQKQAALETPMMGARGKTPRATTANARRSHCITVIAEGRNREVALCCLDLHMPHEMLVSSMVDSRSFVETISLLESYQPVEILMVDAGTPRQLHLEVKKRFKNSTTRIVAIARKYYDQSKGAEDLKRVAVNAFDTSLLKNHVVMGAVACLMKYIEFIQGVYIAQKTIKVVLTMASPVLLMDYATIAALEITRGARNGSIQHSLVAKIDNTRTSIGRRLLRQTILRPSCALETIQARQDVVDVFLNYPSLFFDVLEILPDFADLDKMLSQLVMVPKVITARTSQQGVINVVALKSTLELLPQLHECLSNATSHMDEPVKLLQSIIVSLQCDEFIAIQESIDRVIDPNSQWNRSVRHMKINGSLAVKAGIDGKLDVARATYLSTIDSINERVEEYQDRFGIAIKLHFSVGRGYHLLIPNATGQIQQMHDPASRNSVVLIAIVALACTTKDISSLNSRTKECMNDIYQLSYGVINALLDEIRPFVCNLYAMVESVALLDMLLRFKRTLFLSVQRHDSYRYLDCRPQMCPDGNLVIKKGRHPLIEQVVQDRPFVPNDVPCASCSVLLVITGPNCSGKSTYLKTTAIITLLAHMGCFVPATEARIPLRTRIFTRFGTSDDMEENASTFTVEMLELAFILDNLTARSLILMDELGRGTSNEEGLAIAWSACETLMQTKAYTCFATHFHGLRELSTMYANCRNFHLQATNTSTNLLDFKYKLSDGPSDRSHGYGIQMAKICGIPASTVRDAEALQETMLSTQDVDMNLVVDHRNKNLNNKLLHRLMALRDSKLDDGVLRRRLQHLREQFIDD